MPNITPMKTTELSYFQKALALFKIGYDFIESLLLALKLETKHLAAIRMMRKRQLREKGTV